jgi:multiple sugar transport system permease protein
VPTIIFIIIVIVPMFWSFRLSFLDYNPLRKVNPPVGFDNYRWVFASDDFRDALVNTFKVMIYRVPPIMILSLTIAFLLHRTKRFRGVLRITYLLPWVTSGVAIAWMWKLVFDGRIGPINTFLSLIGQRRHNFLWETKLVLPAITAASIWNGLGYYTLLFAAGLDGIPDVYYDAAKTDGASRWQVFRHVTLPLLNPTIVLVFVLCTISSLHQFGIFRNMTREGRGLPQNAGLVLSLLIYMESFTDLEMGHGAAITVVFLFITLFFTIIQLRFTSRRVQY